MTKVKRPEKGVGKGQAELHFQFESLTLGNRTEKIAADLREIENSQGVKGVDDEGHVIGKTSNKKRIGSMAGGAALGALIGGLKGGAAGAAIGAAAGAAAGLVVGLSLTTTGSQIELQPGSLLTLTVSDAKRK